VSRKSEQTVSLPVALSATIQQGVSTNRVKVKRRATGKPRSSGTALARYRQDRSVRGLETAVTCISMPVGELAELDRAAEAAGVARSHFIRLAVRHFAQHLAVTVTPEQEKRWREALR